MHVVRTFPLPFPGEFFTLPAFRSKGPYGNTVANAGLMTTVNPSVIVSWSQRATFLLIVINTYRMCNPEVM